MTLRPIVVVLVGCALVVGCGTSDSARDTSDPNVLEGDDIERRDIQRVEAMLRGQIAGVHVVQQAGRWSIRIRDSGGFGGSNSDPLFVIDGLPIPLGTEDPLHGINPRDVESIRVLKNASDTAMYGARGANGVVLITTLRPPLPDTSGT